MCLFLLEGLESCIIVFVKRIGNATNFYFQAKSRNTMLFLYDISECLRLSTEFKKLSEH